MQLTLWPRFLPRVRLATAILCAALAVHIVILPLLYVGLDRIIVRTHSELFVAVADAYTRARVREFESLRTQRTEPELQTFIDGIQASGLIAYAEIEWNGHVVRPTPDVNRPARARRPPDKFGEGDDLINHVVAPIASGNQAGELRLGFDEAPIMAHISEARDLMAIALAMYAMAIVGAALVVARLLSRPLTVLQQRSNRIADGDLRHELSVQSGILELDELGESLETMRTELVDAGARLHRQQRLETVGTLAGGVAHEFNNILVPLTLFTESALKALPAEHVARPWLMRAVGAAGRAREVVGKLLLFSGRGAPAALTPMRIAPAVEEALRLFERLRPSSIELDAKIDPDSGPVLAASGLIIQIVMNLCSNAYHAIPPSGGRIEVALRDVEEDGRRLVELIVSDTGVGMDEVTVQRIFEPFFTSRRIGEGTGLGLAVVHGLVQSVGGTINVVSTPGRGTRFRILFPIVR